MPNWAEEIVKSVSVGVCMLFSYAVTLAAATKLDAWIAPREEWHYRLFIRPMFRVSGAVLLVIITLYFVYFLGDGTREFLVEPPNHNRMILFK
jgi:hypothetical protein